MNSRDRVLCALRRGIPDVVPYMYNCMDKDIQERIDKKLYKKINQMIELYKGEFALYARIRLGAAPTLLSMGMEGFSYSLFDEPELVDNVLDGNLVPILDELIKLGMNGIHPLEPGAMDLDYLKSNYGKALCLIGNIDIDKTLSRGTPEDVDMEEFT